MSINFKELPYNYNDLSPHISEKTLEIHHQKHHKGYVEKTNNLIKDTRYEDMTHDQIILNSSGMIFNNSSQAWNHEFYWNSMSPNSTFNEESDFGIALVNQYKTKDKFIERFKEMALNVFGSGWTWVIKTNSGTIDIINLKDGESPLKHNVTPLITCDMWEHAYYLDFQNEKDKYLDSFLEIINWNHAEKCFK